MVVLGITGVGCVLHPARRQPAEADREDQHHHHGQPEIRLRQPDQRQDADHLVDSAALVHSGVDAERDRQDDRGQERDEGQQQQRRQRPADQQRDRGVAEEASAEIPGQQALQWSRYSDQERPVEPEGDAMRCRSSSVTRRLRPGPASPPGRQSAGWPRRPAASPPAPRTPRAPPRPGDEADHGWEPP